MSGPDAEDARLRAAQVFVVVALAAMLVGAVLIIMARDVFVVDVDPGEEETLVRYETPSWEPTGRPISVQVRSFGNFTVGPEPEGVQNETVIRIEETSSGSVVEDDGNGTLRLGQDIWSGVAEPGEQWVVTVSNHGDVTARVSAEAYSRTSYAAGGLLVGIGVLGFVSYRLGIRHSGAT